MVVETTIKRKKKHCPPKKQYFLITAGKTTNYIRKNRYRTFSDESPILICNIHIVMTTIKTRKYIRKINIMHFLIITLKSVKQIRGKNQCIICYDDNKNGKTSITKIDIRLFLLTSVKTRRQIIKKKSIYGIFITTIKTM